MDREKTAAPARGKKKKSGAGSTIALLLIMFLGMAIIAYPTVSDWWNSMHASRAIANYSDAVQHTDTAKIDAMLAAARAYNESLLEKKNPYAMSEEDLEAYNQLLNLSGTGIMGYVQIQSIKVNIPLYHTTDEAVLQVALGHIDWTSLPVGGPSTHCAVSGHRGLPSARLLTDLDKVKEGDTFTVSILNEVLAYEVDQIRIVEPSDVTGLSIVPGEDYVTLVTCTPYGINSHRMLVRGHRIANVDGKTILIAPEAMRIPNYLTIPAVGIPLLFLLLLGMLLYYRIRRPKYTEDEIDLPELDELYGELKSKKKRGR